MRDWIIHNEEIGKKWSQMKFNGAIKLNEYWNMVKNGFVCILIYRGICIFS